MVSGQKKSNTNFQTIQIDLWVIGDYFAINKVMYFNILNA